MNSEVRSYMTYLFDIGDFKDVDLYSVSLTSLPGDGETEYSTIELFLWLLNLLYANDIRILFIYFTQRQCTNSYNFI